MDKAELLLAMINQLKQELARQSSAALTSRDEATHEESKAENKYDMHAQEAAYLAEGQAKLAGELTEAITLFHGLSGDPWPAGKAIGVGALVTLQGKEKKLHFFVGPRSGGLEVVASGQSVTVVTPASPLGRQLLGAKVGQLVQMPGRNAGPHRVVEIA